jgi:hypothetical protein
MDSLSDRLKALGVEIGAQNISPPSHSTPTLREVLAGDWLETRQGRTFIVEKRYPLNHQQGSTPIAPRLNLEEINDWLDDQQDIHLALENLAFLDTETTGLAGGAGTYTFLVGIGRFVENEFQVKQFFMRDPSEESGQLTAVEEYLAPCSVFVTYNGKSFDIPLLKTRFIRQGWTPTFQDFAHIDLLHLSRRVWKYQLPRHKLSDMEADILEFTRDEEDVPGWQVTELFFEYLRTEDPTPLKNIFYHNEMDVLSLSALLNRIATTLNQAASPEQETEPSQELLGVARHFRDVGKIEQAISTYEEALDQDILPEATYWEGLKALSFLYKKQKQYTDAIPLWKQAARAGHRYACVELAKVYEHTRKDYNEALHWTLFALETLSGDEKNRVKAFEWLEALNHRKNRLKRKIRKQTAS